MLVKRYIALQRVLSYSSFTKAARSLGCTQSSISQSISSLEDELNIVLLRRSRNGIELTPEGKEIYPFIDRMIRHYVAVVEQAEEVNHLVRGSITIGTLASVTCHWMPELIQGFQRMYPNVKFSFKQGDYTSIEEWIKNGDVDFGFLAKSAVSDIHTEELKEGKMVAILPSHHRLSGRDVIRLRDISDDPFILLETGSYSEVLEAFSDEGLEPNIKFRIHDDYTIMRMVELGMAVSILAELVLIDTHHDVRIKDLDPPLYRTISLGYTDMDSMSAASRRFIEYIKENIQGLP